MNFQVLTVPRNDKSVDQLILFLCVNFRKSEYCLAKCTEDDRWYRGLCVKSVTDDSVSILYIDFGNIETVHMKDMREMPDHLKFPRLTNVCYLEGKSKNTSVGSTPISVFIYIFNANIFQNFHRFQTSPGRLRSYHHC